MKIRTLIKVGLWGMVTLILIACASEDTQQEEKMNQDSGQVVATFTGAHLVKRDCQAKSRTTATHTRGSEAKVFWMVTDKIWVKADDGRFYQSEAADFAASATPADHSRANFYLAMGSYMKFNPEVRYTNTNSENTVIIAETQNQDSPNDFSHLGAAGDCGTAFAQGGGNDHEFTLDHKASYLCFLPRCMNTALGQNIQLTKIVVRANKPIAGQYNFGDGSLAGKTPVSSSSNSITLTTKQFRLDNTSSDINKNGSYMVIAPGTYNLTIDYTIRDIATNVTATINKTLNNFTCPVGKIRDITANLTPALSLRTKNDFRFYMWDAKQDLWSAYLDSEGNLLSTYTEPQNSSDPRWFHENYKHHNYPLAATQLCKDCPNVNELHWYVTKGDPHWVTDAAYIMEGHLQQLCGIWLKKKAAILRDNADVDANRFTNRTPSTVPGVDKDIRLDDSSWNPASAIPSHDPVPNTTDYFFLPALGYIEGGGGWHEFDAYYGYAGHYWSSTGCPTSPYAMWAFCLSFSENRIAILKEYRKQAMPIQHFE